MDGPTICLSVWEGCCGTAFSWLGGGAKTSKKTGGGQQFFISLPFLGPAGTKQRQQKKPWFGGLRHGRAPGGFLLCGGPGGGASVSAAPRGGGHQLRAELREQPPVRALQAPGEKGGEERGGGLPDLHLGGWFERTKATEGDRTFLDISHPKRGSNVSKAMGHVWTCALSQDLHVLREAHGPNPGLVQPEGSGGLPER